MEASEFSVDPTYGIIRESKFRKVKIEYGKFCVFKYGIMKIMFFVRFRTIVLS